MLKLAEIDASNLPSRARIAAYAIADNIRRPSPKAPSDVPWHGEAVTAEWLTAVVGAETPGAAVESVEVLGGDNGSSARRILAIRWNEAGRSAGLHERLFGKATPTLPMRLSAGKSAPSEGRFLTDLRPHLPIEAPRCLYTARDVRSGRSFHLMEDLTSTHGADFCEAINWRIDKDQATQVVDTLATLHGTFLNPSRKYDVGFLRTYEDFFHAAARNRIEDGHNLAMERAAHVVPASVTARKDRIWPAAVESLRMHDEHPRTVIHSDVHLGNWYVTKDGRMGLSDWARVCRGHWARDLAYSLSTTLTVEDRRAWEKDLIEHYCARHGEVSGKPVDTATAWEGYRRQTFAALLMWTPTLCPPPTLPDMQPESISMEMIRRITVAIDDLDALSDS